MKIFTFALTFPLMFIGSFAYCVEKVNPTLVEEKVSPTLVGEKSARPSGQEPQVNREQNAATQAHMDEKLVERRAKRVQKLQMLLDKIVLRFEERKDEMSAEAIAAFEAKKAIAQGKIDAMKAAPVGEITIISIREEAQTIRNAMNEIRTAIRPEKGAAAAGNEQPRNSSKNSAL